MRGLADFSSSAAARTDASDDRSNRCTVTFAPRSQLPPPLDIKLSEIIDFLVEVGERLHLDRNPYPQERLEYIVENLYREAPLYLSRPLLESMVDSDFAHREALDGWVERTDPDGSKLPRG
jgi:hypothetical protein